MLAALNDDELDDDYPYIVGPNGRYLTEKQFDNLTKHGCSYCGGNLDTEDHLQITWLSADQPVCSDCLVETSLFG